MSVSPDTQITSLPIELAQGLCDIATQMEDDEQADELIALAMRVRKLRQVKIELERLRAECIEAGFESTAKRIDLIIGATLVATS